MSSKLRYLEKSNKEIVSSMYYVDERYTKSLRPQISDWFKKMKPLPGLSRLFQDYNKRYFTINLTDLSLYYAQKEQYSLNDITYIPFEDIVEVKDKPHYALSNQGIEWKAAFGLTIYLANRYIILVAQSNDIYQLWLTYFEAVKSKKTNKSILNRTRTQYYFSLIQSQEIVQDQPTERIVQQQQQEEQIAQDNYDSPLQDIKPAEQQESHLSQTQIDEQDKLQQDLHQNYLQTELYSQKQLNSSISMTITQPSLQATVPPFEILTTEQPHKSVVIDFDDMPVDKLEDPVGLLLDDPDDEIIQCGNVDDIVKIAKESRVESQLQPIRLDNPKSKKQQAPKLQLTGQLKQNITDIWGTYDQQGNPLVKPQPMKSNFIEDAYFLRSNEQQAMESPKEQPDFVIRFDELDSNRQGLD